MKKFFSFVAAALFSAAIFATPAQVPTVAQIEANYDATSDVVLVVYFDEEVCNDIAFMGNYCGWALGTDTHMGEELEGFEGWYVFTAPAVVEETDGDGNPTQALLQAKPVQLKDGDLSGWDYQTGDPDSWVHQGGLEMTISAGYSDEANLEYPAPGVYIYESLYFKAHHTPCVAVPEHDYNITLYAPEGCGYKPAIIGSFNGWSAGVAMTEDIDDDFNKIYKATIHDEEGHEFKFKEVNDTDWSNQIKLIDEEGNAYDNPNVKLGEETSIVLHYENGFWSLCTEAVENVAVEAVATKIIRNGQIIILKGDVEFNVLGTQVK